MTRINKDKELKIRRAKNSDAPQIAVLTGQLGYPATTAQARERLRGIKPASLHAVFVADSAKDGVIGWLHVSKQPLVEVAIRAEVNGLVVAEGQRGLGAGARLLAVAEDWARKALQNAEIVPQAAVTPDCPLCNFSRKRFHTNRERRWRQLVAKKGRSMLRHYKCLRICEFRMNLPKR